MKEQLEDPRQATLPECKEFVKHKPEKYDRVIKSKYKNKDGKYNEVIVDFYSIATAYEIVNAATAHAFKKLLIPGKRGSKSTIQDLREARDSLSRAIELEESEK